MPPPINVSCITGKDRHKMSVKTASNRFILSSLRAGFYQQLFKAFLDLGIRTEAFKGG